MNSTSDLSNLISVVVLRERINICKRHYELLKEDKNDHVCLNLTKKHFSWYLKGFSGASKIRKKFMDANRIEDIKNILLEL